MTSVRSGSDGQVGPVGLLAFHDGFQVLNAVPTPEFINWGQRFTQLANAWVRSRGKDVVVAVVDTGIDSGHPDLRHAVIGGRNFAGPSSDLTDGRGHGTHVAGIIAAAQDSRGVVGVAPEARLLCAKVLDGSGDSIQEGHAADAIAWAGEKGAQIICLSAAWSQPTHQIHRAIQKVTATDPPTLVVCAAGNVRGGTDTVQYPARYAETLAVGSVQIGPGHAPRPAFDTSVGPAIDVVAPGEDILSTYPLRRYARASGTSMAAPFVAGVLALLVSHRRKKRQSPLTLSKVRELIRRTSRDLGRPGKDLATGWGLVDPSRFLE